MALFVTWPTVESEQWDIEYLTAVNVAGNQEHRTSVRQLPRVKYTGSIIIDAVQTRFVHDLFGTNPATEVDIPVWSMARSYMGSVLMSGSLPVYDIIQLGIGGTSTSQFRIGIISNDNRTTTIHTLSLGATSYSISPPPTGLVANRPYNVMPIINGVLDNGASVIESGRDFSTITYSANIKDVQLFLNMGSHSRLTYIFGVPCIPFHVADGGTLSSSADLYEFWSETGLLPVRMAKTRVPRRRVRHTCGPNVKLSQLISMISYCRGRLNPIWCQIPGASADITNSRFVVKSWKQNNYDIAIGLPQLCETQWVGSYVKTVTGQLVAPSLGSRRYHRIDMCMRSRLDSDSTTITIDRSGISCDIGFSEINR